MSLLEGELPRMIMHQSMEEAQSDSTVILKLDVLNYQERQVNAHLHTLHQPV